MKFTNKTGSIWLLLALLVMPLLANAEPEPDEALESPATAPLPPALLDPIAPGRSRAATELQSLEALHKALRSKERQVLQVQQRLIDARDTVTRQELTDRFRRLREELEDQRHQFERFAVNIDLRLFVDEAERPFDWQDELSKLLKPILAELENATAESRAVGELRAQIKEVANRHAQAEQAVERLELLLAQSPSDSLRERLEERLDHWQRIATEAANRHTALDLQLENRLDQRQSMLDETTNYAKEFFRTRGLNLILAVIAFSVVFFGISWLAQIVARLQNIQHEQKFTNRLTQLVLRLLSIFGGLMAMMLVFNLAGDWFMLGIIIIFLIGVAWASINTLPSQVETIKLVLNIGTVREGERVLFHDIPYQVETLGFTVCLVNPLLDGAFHQMPVKAMVGYYSRPLGKQELWFPTTTGDWVELADGRMGQVVAQSPSAVHLNELGGAQTIYPTHAFMALNPRKLSPRFRICATFGIDYQHQAIATTTVVERMQSALEAGLPSVTATPEQVESIEVLFDHAGDSALAYRILVDVAGPAAARRPQLESAIQRLLVETCNAEGWEIPFTQIMLHQAS